MAFVLDNIFKIIKVEKGLAFNTQSLEIFDMYWEMDKVANSFQNHEF